MSDRLIVSDSGGFSRTVQRLAVVDSGGTTRIVRRLFVVDSGGTSRLVFRGSLLDTTLTIGTSSIGDVAYGYNNLAGTLDPYGSMAQTVYDDAGLTSRTVRRLVWNDTTDDRVELYIESSPPNSDTTFRELIANGTSFLRSAATTGTDGSARFWRWSGVVNPLGTSGTVPIRLLP